MSKTINEIYEEVMKSDLLKQGFLAAEKTGTLKAFAEKLGCEADVEEIQTFLKGKLNEDKELSLDELEQAAGGKTNPNAGPACPACGSTNTQAYTDSVKKEGDHCSYQCHCYNCGNNWWT